MSQTHPLQIVDHEYKPLVRRALAAGFGFEKPNRRGHPKLVSPCGHYRHPVPSSGHGRSSGQLRALARWIEEHG